MPADRLLIVFRIVALAAILAAFGQVTLGGVVRVTDSGLGCPDWPLCHGKIIPPFNTPTLIEYSHRLSGSVLGILVIAAAVVAWARNAAMYRARRAEAQLVVRSSIGAVFLVVLAGILGGVTVLTELEWWLVLFHLTIAELLIACLVLAAMIGWSSNTEEPVGITPEVYSSTTVLLVGLAAIGALVLILYGSFMVGYGAGTSCATWPLCRGSVLPEGSAYIIHMGHRYVAAAIGLLILAAAWRVWDSPPAGGRSRLAAGAVFVAFAAQIAIGAYVVWTGFSAELKALHLSMATAAWIAIIAMAVQTHITRGTFRSAHGSVMYESA